MTEGKGCAECTDWGNGNCTSGCFDSYAHDCEHTSLQHGADGCNVAGCLCAFMSWDEF